jgi:hypothetical protein
MSAKHDDIRVRGPGERKPYASPTLVKGDRLAAITAASVSGIIISDK